MARTNDKNSIRQKVFSFLDKAPPTKRATLIQQLVLKFDTSDSYANTLIQNHRKLRSSEQSTAVISIYKVRDIRSNVAVEPYMSKMVKQNPPKGEARDKQTAVADYIKMNEVKSQLAANLLP